MKYAIWFCFLTALLGCATITEGSSQTIVIHTTPPVLESTIDRSVR
jgi:hypothetical protein